VNNDIERIYKEAVVHLIEVRALRALCSSYVLEDPAQAEFCASRNSVYIWSTVTVHKAFQIKSKLQHTGT
jgi:hypothetical protein